MGRDRKRTEPDRMTQADLARVLVVDRDFVTRRVKSGAILVNEDRTIPIHAAYGHAQSEGHGADFCRWFEHTHGFEYTIDSGGQRVPAPDDIRPVESVTPSKSTPFVAAKPPAIRKTIDHWKRLQAKESALKARLDRLRVQGRLVDVSAVRSHLADNAIIIRDRMMQIPDRVAPSVVALSAQAARDLLRREIAEVLAELATDIPSELDVAVTEEE